MEVSRLSELQYGAKVQTASMSISINQDTHRLIKSYAGLTHRPIAEVIRETLEGINWKEQITKALEGEVE